jgi:hypothetical protein
VLLFVHLQGVAASGGVLLELEVIQLHAKHAKQAIAKLLQLRLNRTATDQKQRFTKAQSEKIPRPPLSFSPLALSEAQAFVPGQLQRRDCQGPA